MAYKEIKSLPISDFKNANHMAYMLQVLTIISGQTEIAEEFAKYLAPLRTAYEKEDEVMEKITFSEYTKDIAKADDERDKLLLAFNRVWRAYKEFPDEAKASAAAKIEQYWKVHKVVAEAQYDRETGQMINFIQDMREYCTAAVEELGLSEILDQMEHWNNEVNRLLLVRNEEYVGNKHIAVATARRATDECYLRLVKAINATKFLAEGTEDATRYDRVIDLLNQNIERTLLEVFKRKGQTGVNGGATEGEGSEGENQQPGGSTEGGENQQPGGSTGGSGSGENAGTGGGSTGGSTEGGSTGGSTGGETSSKKTVTYRNPDTGEVLATQEYEVGETIVPPTPPTGFVWGYYPDEMPDRDVTVDALPDVIDF